MLCRAARMIPSLSRQQLPMVCVPSNRRSTRRNASSRDTSGCSISMSGAGRQPPAEAQPFTRLKCVGSAIISEGEAGYACGRMKCAWGCMKDFAWGRFSKIHGACMHCTWCIRIAYPCPLERSCMTTHGGRMAAQVVRVAHGTGACDDIGFQARR